MELSGLIFVALALVWAAVLIPMALRHHDEVAQTRSVDDVSESGRVLQRPLVPEEREQTAQGAATVADGSGRWLRRRSRRATTSPGGVASGRRGANRTVDATASPTATRAAARAAARRRRRVLALLTLSLVGVGAASATGVLLPWAPAIPGALVVLFLVVARLSVRRTRRRRAGRARTVAPPAAAGVESTERAVVETGEGEQAAPAAHGAPAWVPAQAGPSEPITAHIPAQAGPRERGHQESPGRALADDEVFSVVSGLELTAAIPLGGLSQAPTTSPDGLWDPLPMTLPTYVSKPRASRSVRTIDLGDPGVSSSGRSAADSALVAEAATAPPADQPDSVSRRAVGS